MTNRVKKRNKFGKLKKGSEKIRNYEKMTMKNIRTNPKVE